MTRASPIAVAIATTFAVACSDPVHDWSVERLGGEAAGVEPGPSHRPGQPCLACHGGSGPASGTFSLAGTLYQKESTRVPLHGAKVRFIDSTGAQLTAVTNCVGNFFVRDTTLSPVWPVWTKIEYGARTTEMQSAVFREGSCAACHEDPASPSKTGHVYLAGEGDTVPENPCR